MAHIIAGAVAAVLGVMGIVGWWDNFGDFLRGFIPLALLVGGLVAVATGLNVNKRGKK